MHCNTGEDDIYCELQYFMKICNYTEDQKEAKDVSVIINSRKHLCVRDFSNVALYTVRKFN